MTGEIIDTGSTVLCPHGGSATPATSNGRVRIAGASAATMSDDYIVDGCPASTPTGLPLCRLARFVTSASRVRIGGVPVLLRESSAVCEPSGEPAIVAATQSRVTGV